MKEANRDWLTLAFGIGLVTLVVGLSVRQNVQWAARASAEAEVDAATPPVVAASSTVVTPEAVPAVAAEAAASTPGPSIPSAPAPEARRARFDVSVPVVHKHRFGSCEGTLRATNDLLVFGSPNVDDSFQLAFRDVDRFDIVADTLTVRRRGGRTWNFNGQNDSPGPILGFHRAVERARR